MKISFKKKLSILFFNTIWRFIVIIGEIVRMFLSIFLFPIMLFSNNFFIRIYKLFEKDFFYKK
jgi:hypothetical protein